MGRSPIENAAYVIVPEAEQALANGDIEALLSLHHMIFGGFRMEGEDDAEDEGEEDEGDGGDKTDEDKDEDDGVDKSKKSVSAARAKELHDENSRRRNENKQLRDQLAAQAKKLKEIEDADKSESEKVTEERDTLKETNEKLADTNRKLALKVAFLQDSTQTWHNPTAALKLLELDGVEIGEDGEVTGMTEAIKKLAKENPFLLKGKGDEDEEESGAPKSSGQPLGKTVEKQRAALEKKYRLGV